jgi:hypothetical protein
MSRYVRPLASISVVEPGLSAVEPGLSVVELVETTRVSDLDKLDHRTR